MNVRKIVRQLRDAVRQAGGRLSISEIETILDAEEREPDLAWTSLKEKLPPDEEFVLLTGFSGLVTPTMFVCVGRRYETFRPSINGKIRWLNESDNQLTDYGWEPTHWSPMPALPDPNHE